MATHQVMKVVSIAAPFATLSGGAYYWHLKRNEYLSDPVLSRALKHLAKDQRVADFCGEDIKPGFMITREKRPGENWVKYEL